jgi:hypothetical protein
LVNHPLFLAEPGKSVAIQAGDTSPEGAHPQAAFGIFSNRPYRLFGQALFDIPRVPLVVRPAMQAGIRP